MNSRFFITAVMLMLMICGSINYAYAQEYANTPVSVSREKVKINGTVCYSHVVLEKQTLFSISKAYNVSIEDIYRFNPAVKEKGLIKNSILIIPAVESAPEKVVKEEPARNETAPAAAPTPEVRQDETKDVKKKRKTTHTVKWYENIDDIALKYGVSAEEIMAANDLAGKKIKSRMKLVIPEPGQFSGMTASREEPADVLKDTTATVGKVSEEPEDAPAALPEKNEKVVATLLMPFNATGLTANKNNMDFYSGVLMAVSDLESRGIEIELNVHDIAANQQNIPYEYTSGSDVIIGPVSSKDLNTLLSAGNQLPMVVSPLDPRAEKLVAGYTNMIQAPTPYRIQYEDLMEWIKEELMPQDRVLLITEKGARQTEASVQIKAAVDSSGLSYKTFSYSILEGRDVMTPLKELMTAKGINRVVIASESEAFVNDVVRNMNVMIHQKYPVVLYGSSKIRSFDTIEVENFHNVNLHVSLTYFIDYDDPRIKNFLLKYRALFNTEPSQFAFQGYDVATYFIKQCSAYGDNWNLMLGNSEDNMLQSTFRYRRSNDGGYINNGVRRIVYDNDWNVRRIK